MTGHALSDKTISKLAGSHLGAFDVLKVLEVAVAEDVHGGEDLTTVATVSPSSVSSAYPRQKPMPSRLASSNSGWVVGFGIDRS